MNGIFFKRSQTCSLLLQDVGSINVFCPLCISCLQNLPVFHLPLRIPFLSPIPEHITLFFFQIKTKPWLISPHRPQKVCLCPFLPAHPLHISTHLYIIQHPAEENKVLRTVPLLAACLPQDKCKVKIGRRFSEERDPELSTVCRKSGTLILYPGAEAANLEEFILDSPVYPSTIIIIDGTWSQAKDIFYKNSLFRHPKQQEDFHLQARKRTLTRTVTMQVQLKTSISSQYVIRMQPTNRCLSTLECAAVALSILEKNNYIQETLLRPLQALCSFQLQHGAQIRLSKEHLLKNGLYPKPMPKNKRKLRKMELLMNSVKI
ncbi:DTW domain-containing protein 2 isoform X2 [Papio anubis]|uniref:DTW domain-containing protein 2 isoform X2 n=1 Tax=Papio anubis TaxID=9555 RepID=UPI000B7B7E4D|nr:DTW domain-containing protein 2 isoform X2 [Papio anubis]